MGNKLKAAQMFRLLPECDYNLEIMRLLPEYLSTFDFTGIDLLHALQLFIASVKLPGEASLIDRLMTHWAERYTKFFVEIQENWEVCLDGGRYEHKVQRVTDDIFIMAFALVMLETDLKSPLITNKMTWENWRVGILPVEWDVDYLKELYDQVSRL
uniref:SEC7 domain-containing protein n=1 Tax=Arcella intermedia TaxID=1963864 RepID=A0A6B2LLA3_9EUKA